MAALFDGGDWIPASFALRVVPFLLAALALRRDAIVFRPTAPDVLVFGLWALTAAVLPLADYRWISYQWFVHHTAALLFYALVRALPPDAGDRFARAAGLSILAVAALQLPVALYQGWVLGSGRPAGTLANPNFLAEFLLYAVAVAWCWSDASPAGHPVRKAFPAVAAALLAGVLLTKSRGGILIAAAAVAFLAVRAFGWRRVAVAAAVAAVAVAVVPNPLRERFLAAADPMANERLSMWKAAVRIFLEHPSGVGVGHFKYYWQAARDPTAGPIVRYAKAALTPHSELFSILAELGLAGAAGFVGLGLVGAASLRAARRSGDAAARGAAAILLVSYLHSLVQTNYHVMGLLFVNAAALAVVSSRLWRPLFEREVRVKGPVRWAVFVLLLALMAYSGMTLAGAAFERLGRDAVERGRADEAVRRFSAAAAADPLSATYADQASSASYRRFRAEGRPPELGLAIEWEMDAAIRNPVDPFYRERLGVLYSCAASLGGGASGSLLESALRSYDRALRFNPRDAVLRHRRASLLLAAGRADEARAEIERALRDEPAYAPGWVFLGTLLERENRARALDAFRNALRLRETLWPAARDAGERSFLDVDEAALRGRIRELEGGPRR